MNNLLLQMLAARANGNPALAELVGRMRDSSGVNSTADLREMLARQAGNNPLLALLTKQTAESHMGQATAPVVIDVAPTPQAPRSADDAHDAVGGSASKPDNQADTLAVELGVLRERSDLLASAVGACCSCWGEDPQCRLCRGRGRPGFSIPDERLFREFVLPAVQMLRAQRARISGSSPPTNSKTPEANL
jgi:hypothetical protein